MTSQVPEQSFLQRHWSNPEAYGKIVNETTSKWYTTNPWPYIDGLPQDCSVNIAVTALLRYAMPIMGILY